MTLKEILQKIGQRHGIENLNPMQQAVMQARANRIILLAPTGSGKTLGFAVPLISRLSPSEGSVQAVIMAPSRELVIQIAEVVKSVADNHKVVALYGGHNMKEEINSLSVVPDIVVATPGRLLDHILRGTIDLRSVSSLVLDEYDKALELGFRDQMSRIVKRLRRVKYLILTSATPIDEFPDFIDLSQAKVLDFSQKSEAPRERMTIRRVMSHDKDKLNALKNLLDGLPNGRTIIFVNHRESAERVYNFLNRQNMPVGLYHGGLDQLQREIAIDMLNNGSTPILVSTDLGSRGLDISDIKSVVHYHLPPTPESWTHRNGRTARVDASGDIYVLTAPGESLPDYIEIDEEFTPETDNPDPITSSVGSVYFNLGKKEKISKADILGFLSKQCAVSSVGKIVVKDHCAIAAVPKQEIAQVIQTAKSAKIKGQRAKVSEIG